MLPLLPTPFSDRELRSRVVSLLPKEAPPSPPVDVGEALHANWLDLWYQPKIDVALDGAARAPKRWCACATRPGAR